MKMAAERAGWGLGANSVCGARGFAHVGSLWSVASRAGGAFAVKTDGEQLRECGQLGLFFWVEGAKPRGFGFDLYFAAGAVIRPIRARPSRCQTKPATIASFQRKSLAAPMPPPSITVSRCLGSVSRSIRRAVFD